MKTSSKKTMLTAAVLVALSSGTTYAATPGTVDTQEVFHSDHLVTDHSKKPAMEETAATERYEASISQKKNLESAASAQGDLHGKASEPTRLRWESVDTSIAERNAQPSFILAVQKPKPVIITAEDVKREEKQAVKEGRPAQELVGEVNMQRELPPQAPTPPVQQMQVQNVVQEQQPIQAANTQDFPAEKTAQTIQPKAEQSPSSFHLEEQTEQRPLRPHYPEMPHKSFSLMSPVDVGALPKLPERFHVLETNPEQRLAPTTTKDAIPVAEHSVRPEGVPAFSSDQTAQGGDADLAGISDEVRRHILAGQLAMEIQLRRDPSVAGMRAITKVLRENMTLTHLQKIDFLIGFGRALHQSRLPRQQEALLIKTIAESF